MLIQNVHIENQAALQSIRIENGIITAIETQLGPQPNEHVIDGHEQLALPPFVDPHIHLDSTLTAGQPEWNESGTLFDGIRIWSERKKDLTHDDVKRRAIQALKLQARHGIQFVRSHVDVTDPNLVALKALLEVREAVKDWMTLQLVAFPQEGILSFPNGQALMTQAAQLGVDAIGAIPHFEFNREYAVASLKFAFQLAQEYDLLFDAHTDEIDDPNARSLETVATLALETGMQAKVTASHTTAMGCYNDAYMSKLMRLLKMADLNFIANPLVNLFLGGRFDTYPKRRGLTRVKELTANGLNVAFGEDDIQDPWYPMGNGNMLDVLYSGLLATQIMGHTEIMNAYRFITYNGARAMHVLDQYGIEVGKPAHLILMDSDNFYDALNKRATVTLSIHAGKVISETQPAKNQLHI